VSSAVKVSNWLVFMFIHAKWIALSDTVFFFSTVTAFFQFLEVNGLYFMQVTLQDGCNVVLNYVEVELKKKTLRMSSFRVKLQQGCTS
jgi:hypothetical protein